MRKGSARRTSVLLSHWIRYCFVYTIVVSLLVKHACTSPSSKPARGIPRQTDVSDAGPPNQDHPPRRSERGPVDSDWGSSKSSPVDDAASSTDEAGEAHEEPTRSKCCYRQRKYHTIGFDTAARKPIRKDVGRCRRTYLGDPAPRNPTPDFRDLVRRKRRQEATCDQQCDDGNTCLPTRILLERSLYANAWSPLDYEVIEDCQCVPRIHPCERMPLYKVFHHNTPYETTIDVGECRGRCFTGPDSDIKCRAVKNKTQTVIGPNGHECVDVITSCSCTQSCYRASHMVAFYVRKYNETTGEPYNTVQEMDVGKCVGSCTERKGICIRHTDCAAVLLPNTYCSPKEYVPHMFQTTEGEDLMVHVINECRCI